MSKLEALLIVAALAVAVLLATFSYHACRAKFPEAPAWSCFFR